MADRRTPAYIMGITTGFGIVAIGILAFMWWLVFT